MLYLKPPFHIIAGTAVFSDHADPRQFYYLPAMPKLTTSRDPATGVDIPRIQLIKFRGDAATAGNGGFLTFEVDLEITEEQRRAILTKLSTLYDLDGEPILSPAILEDGTVRLLILGEATPTTPGGQPPPPAEGTDEPRFVVKIEHAAKPALYGTNQAVFSVELDQDGVVLVEASLAGELMPIGVVYSLDFLALRPAFTVKVSVDWSRVQTHFKETFSGDILFFSWEIDKVVDKLVETGVIKIEVDSFLPEGEDAGSWVGRRDQAIKDFKDMVITSLFKPSLDPMKKDVSGWDEFADTTERLASIGARGGAGSSIKFGYSSENWTRIDQKTLNLTMNERVTVKRTIYPQAALSGLARVVPKRPDGSPDVSRFVTLVDLNDPWYASRALKAHALVDFANDSVDSVNLTVTYNGLPKTIRLTAAEMVGERNWGSVVVNRTMVRPIEYEYRVNFKGVDNAERPDVLFSPKRTTIADEFEITPRGDRLYYLDDIQISGDLLPWDRFPNVNVEVQYDDPVNGIRLAESFLLSRAAATATWKRFRLDPLLDNYQLRITYLSAEGRDITQDWKTTNQERLIIRDPRPMKRVVQVVPSVDWRLVVMVLVELRYIDPDNQVEETRSLSFLNTPVEAGPKTFSVNLVDPSKRVVSYATTFVLRDRTIYVPASMTLAQSIVLRTDMVGHRVVTVRPPMIDFGANGILWIEAACKFADPEADPALSFADVFRFLGPGEARMFEYDYVAQNRSSYSCDVTIALANGMLVSRKLGPLGDAEVVLPSG